MSSYFIGQFIDVPLGSKVCQFLFKQWPSWAGGTWSVTLWDIVHVYVVLLGRRDCVLWGNQIFPGASQLPWSEMPLIGEAKTQNAWSFPQLPISLPFKFKFILCVCVLSACTSVFHSWAQCTWSYRWLCVTIWVLGIEPLSSRKAVSAFNCWGIPFFSSVLPCVFVFVF